ncbi:MAG: LAGLIDADG family homing endonuclease [Candidatus Omnitrophica bacterium]|nr:LAGLIDADG family homing endonuclease [Candidatus Omnitrophota bacterium]
MAGKRKSLKLEDALLWYLVGLITSDGCLSSDGRHVDITAKDQNYLEALKRKIGILNKVGVKNRGERNQSYHLQISNIEFYEFLLSRGLSPRKSLILKEVMVPPTYFTDFCRGIIDGDGNIRRWTHPTNRGEQWVLRIYSAAKDFIVWLQGSIEPAFGATGRIHTEKKSGKRNDIYILKYGKMAAKRILKDCYYENATALDRKARLAQECCLSKACWTKSKTTVHLN